MAVDLQPMAPLPDVTTLVGDITKASTAEKIVGYFKGDLADCTCDFRKRIANIQVTCRHAMKELMSSQLCPIKW